MRRTRSPWAPLVVVALAAVASREVTSSTARAVGVEEARDREERKEAPGWVRVDYGDLVDRRRLSHSGESVGALLRGLEGRPFPPPGERPTDALSHVLLDPLLEPYAFVLIDALDSLAAVAANPSWVEVGRLWQAGEVQPAWVELLRSRSLVVESDGEGRFRLCLPWQAGDPATASAAAAQQAWETAWPVLRHVFSAEQRRLASRRGDRPQDHALEVEVHAYVHDRARTTFRLGLDAYRTRVADTRPRGDRPLLDLDSIQGFLDRGLQIEGGRLEPDGTLRLLGSEAAEKPSLLGRPLGLSDLAVAYRAVSHGGLAEPYMSLDRGNAPQTSIVNYGGRLRDTSLGWTSLLCDVRFKTFSLGIDVIADSDVRERLRAEIPEFRTHLERLAADTRAQGVAGQQTRLWFYPDSVDLTLSEQGDVMVVRRVRMTASSERVREGTVTAARQDPPWTVDTVAAINGDYDKLGRFFPELKDLDQVARLLSLFTWLSLAKEGGHAVPDLDTLLAVELPALPTPRQFPQLLVFSEAPSAGQAGPLEVFDRLHIAEALDRMQPSLGSLPAARRFERALSGLNRRIPDQAALARELESVDRGAEDGTLDGMAFRAERLEMHQLVLSTLGTSKLQELLRRSKAEPGLRVFNTGIGGLDLGMRKILARASRRTEKLPWGGAGGSAAPRQAPQESPTAMAEVRGPKAEAGATVNAREDWRAEPSRLPPVSLPDHGKLRSAGPTRTGASTWGGKKVSWTLTVMGSDDPAPSSRRVVTDGGGRVEFIERLEEQRFLRYRLEREGGSVRAVKVGPGLPPQETRTREASEVPPGLAILDLPPSPTPSEETEAPSPRAPEASTIVLRLRGTGSSELAAPFPRSVLQRLLLGHEADPSPGQPLPGLSPPGQLLGDLRHVMVLMKGEQSVPPWEGPKAAAPGEENPVRVATALRDWWRSQPDPPGVVVGTDASASPGRWKGAPRPGRDAILLLPTDAFPGPAARLRDDLAKAWKEGRVDSKVPSDSLPTLVVLVSAEAPALLGGRLRDLAQNPKLKGKMLAVCSLTGPVREDLPSFLLAQGNLAALGLYEASSVGVPRVSLALAALAGGLAAPGAPERRVEELPGPFLWFF